MDTIEDFYSDFMQQIYSDSDVSSDFKENQFYETIMEYIVQEGIVLEPNFLPYRNKAYGMKSDGYELTEDREVLNLFLCDFVDEQQLISLINSDIKASLGRVKKFFIKSTKEKLFDMLEESSPGYESSHFLYHNQERFKTIRIMIITNKTLSKSVKSLPSETIDSYKVIIDIWDMSRIYEIETSKNKKETLIINFEDDFNYKIPSLSAHVSATDYKSFLCVMNGEVLSKLYEKYGATLLESNVRSFLQLRGNVNKGIRQTINEDPDMFFAYNNGITATAEEVQLSENNEIVSLKNFQIVNGGQTTASLYSTKLKDGIKSLENIFVQMKLTVINDDKVNDVVPLISRYANTQNKVNEADFFSNDIFHIRMEEKSRRITSPLKEGEILKTKWFYERARGQYQESHNKLTKTKQETFKKVNPKHQMFSKTDLAKYLMVWENKPHIVSLGAQKNFIEFGKLIVPRWNKNENEFNDMFYKHAIAKIIIFKACDKIVFKEPWYGGYKANIVAYTLSTISYILDKNKISINFDEVWKNQKIDNNFEDEIRKVSEFVNNYILNTPENFTNVSEWCKRELCWTKLKDIINHTDRVTLSENFIQQMITKEEINYDNREARDHQKIENQMEQLKILYSLNHNEWNHIITWGNNNNLLIDTEIQFLNLIPTGKYKNENQLKRIVSIINKLEDEGMPPIFVKSISM